VAYACGWRRISHRPALAAIDDRLNDHDYILPGLGDACDRIFGTLAG
jgi:hypothetical protein